MTTNDNTDNAPHGDPAGPNDHQDAVPTRPLESGAPAPQPPTAAAAPTTLNGPDTPAAASAGEAADTAPQRSFFQRTWVRATGAALAAVVLLGAGAGTALAIESAGQNGSRGPQGQVVQGESGDDLTGDERGDRRGGHRGDHPGDQRSGGHGDGPRSDHGKGHGGDRGARDEQDRNGTEGRDREDAPTPAPSEDSERPSPEPTTPTQGESAP